MFRETRFQLGAVLLLTLSLVLPSFGALAARRDVLTTIGGFIAPISQQQEVYAGAQLDNVVRERYKPSDDVALQAYVNSIGKRVAAKSRTNYPFSFTVLADSRTANAFSGPGGFVYITTGMLNLLENESQLAAVLGHEVAHVVKRHVVKQLQEQNATDLALVVISRVTDVNLNQRVTRLGEFVLFQRFSREDEFEADNLGTRLMVRSGYNPTGMVQLLEKLNALESRGIVIGFLQSHPSSEERAQLVREFIIRSKLEKPTQILDTPDFHQALR